MEKVNTIEQFKVLEYLKIVFDMNYITLDLVDECTIKVTDKENKSMYFKYNKDKKLVEWYED